MFNGGGTLYHYLTLSLERQGIRISADMNTELTALCNGIEEAFNDLNERVKKLEGQQHVEASKDLLKVSMLYPVSETMFRLYGVFIDLLSMKATTNLQYSNPNINNIRNTYAKIQNEYTLHQRGIRTVSDGVLYEWYRVWQRMTQPD